MKKIRHVSNKLIIGLLLFISIISLSLSGYIYAFGHQNYPVYLEINRLLNKSGISGDSNYAILSNLSLGKGSFLAVKDYKLYSIILLIVGLSLLLISLLVLFYERRKLPNE